MSKAKVSSVLLRFLRELRGERSQDAVAAQLGKSHDVVSRWESGATHIKWRDFCRLIEAHTAGAARQMAQILALKDDLANWYEIVPCLAGPLTAAELKSRLRLNMATCRAWLEPDANPRVVDALFAIDRLTPSLILFMSVLMDLRNDPDLSARFHSEMTECSFQGTYPIAPAMRCAMAAGITADGTAAAAELASRLGVSTKNASECLTSLIGVGLVKEKDAKYVSVDFCGNAGLGEPKNNLSDKRYWLRRAEQGCREGKSVSDLPNSHFGHVVFAYSEPMIADIEKLTRHYFSQVMNVIREGKADGETLGVGVLGIQLMDEEFLSTFPES